MRTLAPVSDSLPSTAFLKKTDRIVGCLAKEVGKGPQKEREGFLINMRERLVELLRLLHPFWLEHN